MNFTAKTQVNGNILRMGVKARLDEIQREIGQLFEMSPDSFPGGLPSVTGRRLTSPVQAQAQRLVEQIKTRQPRQPKRAKIKVQRRRRFMTNPSDITGLTLSITEAARVLGKTYQFVHNHMYNGQLKRLDVPGMGLRVATADVMAFGVSHGILTPLAVEQTPDVAALVAEAQADMTQEQFVEAVKVLEPLEPVEGLA